MFKLNLFYIIPKAHRSYTQKGRQNTLPSRKFIADLEEEIQFSACIFFLLRAVINGFCSEGLAYCQDYVLSQGIIKTYTPTFNAVFIAEVTAVTPVSRFSVVGTFIQAYIVDPPQILPSLSVAVSLFLLTRW